VIIDYGGAVTETSEGDNTWSQAISVVAPDLSVSATFASPTAFLWKGSEYTVPAGTITVSNIGSSASGTISYGIYLSTDTAISTSDTLIGSGTMSSIGAGSSAGLPATLVTVLPTQTTGSYYLGIIIDPSGSIAESNESNNVSRSSTTVFVRAIPSSPTAVVGR
jgi:subtilase family serine protease